MAPRAVDILIGRRHRSCRWRPSWGVGVALACDRARRRAHGRTTLRAPLGGCADPPGAWREIAAEVPKSDRHRRDVLMNAQLSTRYDLPDGGKTFLLDRLTSGQTNHLQHAARPRSMHRPTASKQVRAYGPTWRGRSWVTMSIRTLRRLQKRRRRVGPLCWAHRVGVTLVTKEEGGLRGPLLLLSRSVARLRGDSVLPEVPVLGSQVVQGVAPADAALQRLDHFAR